MLYQLTRPSRHRSSWDCGTSFGGANVVAVVERLVRDCRMLRGMDFLFVTVRDSVLAMEERERAAKTQGPSAWQVR